jgi:hypothetical protein
MIGNPTKKTTITDISTSIKTLYLICIWPDEIKWRGMERRSAIRDSGPYGVGLECFEWQEWCPFC